MILVTGGAGLLGNELINQLLEKRKKVKAIYLKLKKLELNTKPKKKTERLLNS